MALTDNFSVFARSFFEAHNVLFRNDENMCGCLGINIFKGKRLFVFIDFFGGDFTANNFAEKTISHAAKYTRVIDRRKSCRKDSFSKSPEILFMCVKISAYYRNMRIVLILLVLSVFPMAYAEPGAVRLGNVHFQNSCTEAVQPDFNRGVALLYSFEYEEAITNFRAALHKDPACSIAEWGIAMARLQRLGAQASVQTLQEGWSELQPVLEHPSGSVREREYLSAVAELYRDFKATNSDIRSRRYEIAMRQLHAHYPGDDNAALYYAMSLNLGAPGGAGLANRRRSLAIVSQVFKRNPNHPGAAHFIIHICDTPELAPLGLEAARKYASIAPASPHALHMPSHIFSRLGMWNDSIQSNLKSAEVAHQWLEQGRKGAYFDEQHARNQLEYSYLQIGEDAKALDQIEILERLQHTHGVNDPWAPIDGRIYYDMEVHDWKHAQTIEAPAEAKFSEDFDVYWIKTMAAARLGDVKIAGENFEKFKDSVKAYGQMASFFLDSMHLNELQAHAWLQHAQHKDDAAIETLNSAVRFEQAHPIYYPDVLTRPSEESLGDLLMDLHQPKQALQAYKSALVAAPYRFDSLYGAFQAARAASENRNAKMYAALLLHQRSSESDRPELVQVRAWMEVRMHGNKPKT